MFNASLANQLDNSIESLLVDGDSEASSDDPVVCELLAVAGELCTLPDPDFKSRLKAELIEQAEQEARSDSRLVAFALSEPERRSGSAGQILPTLFGTGYDAYPVQRSSFMVSALTHTAALALLVTVGIFAAKGPNEVPRVSSVVVTDLSPYPLPPDHKRTGGGGGGGDHDPLQASKGHLPRFANEQIAPPAIVVRNEQARLKAEPTVVGPPNLSFPQSGPLGDPLTGILGPPSNGPGSFSGIGDGAGAGVGIGVGPGVGKGYGGGIGNGIYRVGAGVSAPHAVYEPEPEYSEEARKARYQGVVVLQVVIGADGRPSNIQLARTLGMGLDEKAVDAVHKWRFEPARKDGQPVAVMVNIEVSFRLY